METFGWRKTITQVAIDELNYPGLQAELAIMAWQKRLIEEEQMGEKEEGR